MKAPRILLSALLVGVALLALSCGEPSPLGVEPTAPPPAHGLLGWFDSRTGLLQCSTLPADSASETIGPEGGVLRVGPHRLSIPPGALAEPVTISAVTPSDTVNRVQFQPEGLLFERHAYLTMSYANCGLLRSVPPKQIAYTTDLLEILFYLPSLDNVLAQEVTGRLDHFSTYAIAW